MISTIIALITAIAAIAAPVITSVINNRHQIKITELEVYTKHRIEVIDNYVAGVAKYLKYGSREDFAEYAAKVFMYVPEEYWKQISLLNEMVNSIEEDANARRIAFLQLEKVSQSLSTYTSSLHK